MLAAAAVLAAMAATVDASMQVRVTNPSDATGDSAHTRTLTAELQRALDRVPTPDGYTLDVSLAGVRALPSGRDVAVRVETRAALSDAKGYVRWVSTAGATARGSLKDRDIVERDAITAVATELARQVRQRGK